MTTNSNPFSEWLRWQTSVLPRFTTEKSSAFRRLNILSFFYHVLCAKKFRRGTPGGFEPSKLDSSVTPRPVFLNYEKQRIRGRYFSKARINLWDANYNVNRRLGKGDLEGWNRDGKTSVLGCITERRRENGILHIRFLQRKNKKDELVEMILVLFALVVLFQILTRGVIPLQARNSPPFAR